MLALRAEAESISAYQSTITFKNTLIANNTGGNCFQDAGGTFVSDGYNLDNDGSCLLINLTDLHFSSTGLAAGPANNGGSTQTIALLAGSPAIDAIPVVPINNCTDIDGNPVATDQRGVSRPAGAGCDIGAYEFVPVVPQVVPFASMNAYLEHVFNTFALTSGFTLGAGSNGINPVTEGFTMSVGTYNVTLPAGSFHQVQIAGREVWTFSRSNPGHSDCPARRRQLSNRRGGAQERSAIRFP